MDEGYFEHKDRKYTTEESGRILYGLIEVPDPRSVNETKSAGERSKVVQLDDYRSKPKR